MIEKIFIRQGINKVELDNYLAKELDKAGFTKSEIMKTPLVTRIVVNVTRPGLAIGKSGSNITQLTETIGKKFGIDNPQLEIKEITRPDLDAQAVANKFKALVEKGFSWRSVVFKGLNDIQNAGAQGVEIIVSGKLSGKGGRKKRVRVAAGYMKKVGEQAKLVDYGYSPAYPKVGAIGIKVKIVKPDTIFPDKEKIGPYIQRMEGAAAVLAAAEQKASAETQAAVAATEEKPAEQEEVKESGKEKPKEHAGKEKAPEKKEHKDKKAPEHKAAEKAHKEGHAQEQKRHAEPGEPKGSPLPQPEHAVAEHAKKDAHAEAKQEGKSEK